MSADEMHQIGEAAEAAGLSMRTIRYYEEVGLVTPSGRTTGGFRLYTDDDIARLRLIKHLKPLEFSLEDMRDVLHALDRARTGTDDDREDAVARLRLYVALAQERVLRLREQLHAAEMTTELLREATLPARGRR